MGKFSVRKKNILIGFIPASFLLLSGCVSGQAGYRSLNPLANFEKSTVSEKKKDSSDASPYYHFLKAQLFKKHNEIDKALFHIEKAAKLDNRSIEIIREYASLLIVKKRYADAVKLINGALKNNPDDKELLKTLAGLRLVMKQDDKAASIYSRLIDIDPKDKNLFYILGGLYTERKEYDKAIQVFRHLTREIPDFFGGYYYLGLLHKKKDNLYQSVTALKKAVEINPDFEAGRFELIDIYEKQKSNSSIIEACRAILSKNPGNIRAALYLSLAYISDPGQKEKGDKILTELGSNSKGISNTLRVVLNYFISPGKYGDAVVLLKGMLKGAPENSDLLYYLAASYEGMKNDQESINYLKQISPDSEYYVEASLHTGLYYYYKKDIKTAFAILENALKNKPGNEELVFELANFLKEKNLFEKSEKVFLEGISFNKKNSKLIYSLGVLYDKWNKKIKSLQMMRKVLELEPENVNAMNYLGYTYADSGKNLKEAETLIKKALEYKPGDGYITDSLGWVYFKQGNFKKALKFLTAAVEKIPNDPVLLEHLGDALIMNDLNGKALEMYKKSLKNKNTNPAAINLKIENLLKKLSCGN